MDTVSSLQADARQVRGEMCAAGGREAWIEVRLRAVLIARERSFAAQAFNDVLWSFALHAFCDIQGTVPFVSGVPGLEVYRAPRGDRPSGRGDEPTETTRGKFGGIDSPWRPEPSARRWRSSDAARTPALGPVQSVTSGNDLPAGVSPRPPSQMGTGR